MADIKISDMPVKVGDADLTDEMEINDSGSTKRLNIAQIIATVKADTDFLLDSEIGINVQAYDANIPTVVMTQGEAEAGTSTDLRTATAERMAQAIAAQAPTLSSKALTNLGVLAQHTNLKIVNHVTVPARAITVTADALMLEDVSGNQKKITSLAVDVDITAAGAAGLDTGSEAASTWYHVWTLAKEDGTKTVVFSTSTTFAGVTKPTDYIYGGYIGALYNNNVGTLSQITQINTKVSMDIRVIINGTVTEDAWASISVAGFFPVTATSVIGSLGRGSHMGISFSSDGDAGAYYHGSLPSSGNDLSGTLPSTDKSVLMFNLPNLSTTMYYWINVSPGTLYALGWEF